MRKLTIEAKQEIQTNPFYLKCCIADFSECKGRIEIHHNMIFGGRQVDDVWTLLPLCHRHHELEKYPEVKERLNYIMLQRASDAQISPYCKVIPYLDMKYRLQKIYAK